MQKSRLVALALVTVALLVTSIAGYQFVASRIPFVTADEDFPLKQQWSFVTSAPVIGVSTSTDGVIAVRTTDAVIGLDAVTGYFLWQTVIEGHAFDTAPPVLSSGQAAVANQNGVWMLDDRTGQVIWNVQFIGPTTSGQVNAITSCCVVVDRASLGIEVYDRVTGTRKWTVATSRGFVAAYSQDQELFLPDRGVSAYDASTGQLLWAVGGDLVVGSTFEDGILYFNDNEITLKAIDTRSKTILWRTDLLGNGVSEITRAGDDIAVLTGRRIYAVDRQTGSVIWSKDRTANNAASIGNEVYVADSFGQGVTALEATTGQELGHIQFGLPQFFIRPTDTIDAHNDTLVIGFGTRVYKYGRP